jgi:hypothetical protein
MQVDDQGISCRPTFGCENLRTRLGVQCVPG